MICLNQLNYIFYRISQRNWKNTFYHYYLIWLFTLIAYIFAIPFHRIHSEITVSLPDTYHTHVNTNNYKDEYFLKNDHFTNVQHDLTKTDFVKNKHQNTNLLLLNHTNSILDRLNETTLNELRQPQLQQQQPTETLHFQSGSKLFNTPLHIHSPNRYFNELKQHYSNVWLQQRKHLTTTSKYHSNAWTTLHVENCYQVGPAPDLLSEEEIHWYERNLFNYDNKKRFSRQIERKYKTYSRRLPSLKKSQWLRNKRRWITTPKRFSWLKSKQHRNDSLFRSKRSIHSSHEMMPVDQQFNIVSNTVMTNQNVGNQSLLKHPHHHRSTNNLVAVITVHKIAIRPSVLILKQGNVQVRLHYVMQLHKELTEQYRLILEVRIDPEFPPLYIGVIQNVCDYWPANVPQSKCSQKRPRFYQKNTMCFCNMPPGIYGQRVKLNLNNILDELELPRFLVNFLFSDKKVDVHITIKLEMENKDLVGCMKMKLPLQFVSA
ncbi:unnamed protein product [Schistosoma turkestanicum]|nr:unnamed protein product [Schistosoma turkestanicum]